MSLPITAADLRDRRRRVEERYLQGVPLGEIAKELSLEYRTVATDVRWIRIGWLRQRQGEGAMRLELELRKIDRLEREAWRAWIRSQKDIEVTKISSDGVREKAERTIRRQAGDARFLAMAKDCIDRRCRLLGMLPAIRTKHESEQTLPAVEVLVESAAELDRLWSVDDLLQRMGREPDASPVGLIASQAGEDADSSAEASSEIATRDVANDATEGTA